MDDGSMGFEHFHNGVQKRLAADEDSADLAAVGDLFDNEFENDPFSEDLVSVDVESPCSATWSNSEMTLCNYAPDLSFNFGTSWESHDEQRENMMNSLRASSEPTEADTLACIQKPKTLLRLVEGRLQVVGFPDDLPKCPASSCTASRPRKRPDKKGATSPHFWSAVFSYLLQ